MAWEKDSVTVSGTDWVEVVNQQSTWEKVSTLHSTSGVAGYAIAGTMIASNENLWQEDS